MKNIQENEQNRFLLDLKLLSSLKSIKGKVIHLDNKANNSDINTNITNSFDVKKQNIVNNNNNILNINLGNSGRLDYNNLSNNNNYCQNQYLSNMSIKNQKNMYTNSIIQDPFCLVENHLNENPHRSLLSFEEMNSKEGYNILNNTIKKQPFKEKDNNKFSQDSFMFLNNNNIEDDINKNKNNNLDTMNIFISNVNNSYTNNINNNYFNNINSFCFNNNINKNNTELSFNQDNIDDFLYKKRKSDIIKQSSQKANSSGNKNNRFKKNIFKTQKNNKDINKNRIRPKIIFNCYQSKQKSKFRKQKNKKNNFSFRCSHINCEYAYKTLKQLQNHHYKMMSECQNDLIFLLKEIYNTKLILIKCISSDVNKKKYFSELYEKSIKNISLNQYTETISGTHLEEFF